MRRRGRCFVGAAAIAVGILLGGAAVAPTWGAYAGTTDNAVNDLSAASSFYRAQVLADAPVSYWRLGATSGTVALDTQGTSNGVFEGGYTLGQSDALVNDGNPAVDFDGLSGRVMVPDAAALRLSTTVSIEAWVRPDSLTGTRWIVNKGTFYYLYISDGTTIFGIRNPAAQYIFITTTLVTTGSWQHLVGTYDGATMPLYRNGVSVTSLPKVGTITSTTVALYIGAISATGSFFDGRIDEVAVYSRALTAAQVLAHYQRGATTQP
jgi:concanavalin A-like lectin/glucanase superfamily protein